MTERPLCVAYCTECDGGNDLPVESRGPVGPYLLGVYHADQTGHVIEYGTIEEDEQ